MLENKNSLSKNKRELVNYEYENELVRALNLAREYNLYVRKNQYDENVRKLINLITDQFASRIALLQTKDRFEEKHANPSEWEISFYKSIINIADRLGYEADILLDKKLGKTTLMLKKINLEIKIIYSPKENEFNKNLKNIETIEASEINNEGKKIMHCIYKKEQFRPCDDYKIQKDIDVILSILHYKEQSY